MTTEGPTDYDRAKEFLEAQHRGEKDSFEPSPLVGDAYYSPTDKWEDSVDKKLRMLQLEVTVSGVGAVVAIGFCILLGRTVVKLIKGQGQIAQVLQQAGMVASGPPPSEQTTASDATPGNGDATVAATAPPPSQVKYNLPEKVITDAPPIDQALLEDLKRTMGEDISGNAHPQ